MSERTKDDLKQLQLMPLDVKVLMTQTRIREWVREFGESGVYVSFSGGKDSTVLLDIVRKMFPDIEAVFVDTGLEYPEIRQFVKTFDNVTILRPDMRFDEVIKKYGYPMLSKEISECIDQGRKSLARKDGTYNYRLLKLQGVATDKNGNLSKFNKAKYQPLLTADFLLSNWCCKIMKKRPVKSYEKSKSKMPLTAQMACKSALRAQWWVKNGCNGFKMKSPISNPMSFWTEQDVLKYIKENNLKIASVYGDVVPDDEQICFEGCEQTDKLTTTGCHRTGCIFCGFGCHLEKGEGRFERLKRTHPKQYAYCMNGGEYDERGLWIPNKQGLGMKHVIDELNKLYGDDFIRY